MVTHLVNTPSYASEIAILVGLGVGIDYSLFVVTRFREAHQANGGNVEEAVAVAMSTCRMEPTAADADQVLTEARRGPLVSSQRVAFCDCCVPPGCPLGRAGNILVHRAFDAWHERVSTRAVGH